MNKVETVLTRSKDTFELNPAVPTRDQNARVRDLTPAQRRAVAFAQQQVLRARAAKKAKEERQASLNKMWMQEDGVSATQQDATQSRQNQQVIQEVSLREALGHVLRELRTNDHKTLREVSEKAGVSLGYLSEVERGQKEASSELLSSIADALGLGVPQTLRLVADYLESHQN
ncbi:transcriptional regulator [Bombiscardovia apis]|uniref:Transcriptional regulator n=1 Tax=Bombiscardovia apis TaxID=2932182 RepID=A0ABM8BD13_9BIFI|nr:helix-turn-helix transcriptional regulator [Bombiscardovia apis]BDR54803.1 transcriptional regulator [Bombiscardovia apis]